ncbi:MAG TPA: tRNA uracil 4-sulfurtransferase ThiI, partial [Acholeplasma sp.]|nr:tRNA uracil 4-sulfurtransferase ThiI [Acholeplasma sp.]
RFFIVLNGEDEKEIIPILQKIFGIHSLSLAIKVKTDQQEIVNAAYQIVKDDKVNQTFKVYSKRRNKKIAFRSDELIPKVAGMILENTHFKVDLDNYDVGIIIEMEMDSTYVMGKVYLGAGGYPVGVSGKAMVLLSGGIDSPVAANLIQKRGVYIEAIHFASPPYTSEHSLEKVERLAKKISFNQQYIKLYVIPFTKLQLMIHKHIDEAYEIAIMRRMMFRIAQQLANQNNCNALVTGESLGQVSSQTMENISVINAVCEMPVFRPLISMDKHEIIAHSRRIDCYDISIEPYDDACTIFNPKNPSIKPKLSFCEFYERHFDYQSLIDEAIADAQIKFIRYDDKSEDENLF